MVQVFNSRRGVRKEFASPHTQGLGTSYPDAGSPPTPPGRGSWRDLGTAGLGVLKVYAVAEEERM